MALNTLKRIGKGVLGGATAAVPGIEKFLFGSDPGESSRNALRQFGLGGSELARVPGPGTEPGDTFYFGEGFFPDFVQTVPVKQHGNIQRVA